MKCPLGYRLTTDAKSVLMIEAIDCLKEECAWWDKRNHRCLRVSESYDLSYIRATLQEMAKKMPIAKE